MTDNAIIGFILIVFVALLTSVVVLSRQPLGITNESKQTKSIKPTIPNNTNIVITIKE